MFSCKEQLADDKEGYELEFSTSSLYEACIDGKNIPPMATNKSIPKCSQEQSQNEDIQVVRHDLMQKAQQIVEQMNEKRQKDDEVLLDLKEAIRNQIEKHFETFERAIQDVYLETSKLIEKQLKKLSTNAYRIRKMQKELEEMKSATFDD